MLYTRLSTFHGTCARKHIVCIQGREGKFTFEQTLMKILFTKLKVSLKQPGGEMGQQKLERTVKEGQLGGAVIFRRGHPERRELEKL